MNVPSFAAMPVKQLWILVAKLSLSAVFFDTDTCGGLSNDCSRQVCVRPHNYTVQLLQSPVATQPSSDSQKNEEVF